MKFLAVDDSATMRKIVSLALSGAGHEVHEAGNGKEALEALGKASYDCLVLDINMPEMNGIELLKVMRSPGKFATIPVIVLTTQDEEVLKNEALASGANAFLAKPFKKEELLATIKAVVGS